MGQGFDAGPIEKSGKHLANRCHLCGEDEEPLDHIMLQCIKALSLWDFLQFFESPGLIMSQSKTC